MKICYLAYASSGHANRWANYFFNCGYEVHIISWRPRGGSTPLSEGIHFHRMYFPPHYIFRYGALLEITLMLARIKPDIIHGHNLSHMGMLAGLCGYLTSFKPIVLTAWGSDILIHAQGSNRRLIKAALDKADLITCQGESVADGMVELGIDNDKIEIIPFGVDVNEFQPLPEETELKDVLRLGESQVVISVRAFEPIYNVESLIRAIPFVVKRLPETKFVLLGKGSLEEYLHNLAEELGISKNIIWTGRVPRNDIPGYYSISDLYVSTSLSDSGLSLSNAEAMSCGLPVILTDIADSRLWVKDGINGYIVPVKSPAVLAEKIVTALTNPEFLGQAGLVNRDEIIRGFNYYTEMGKVRNKYEEILKSH